MKAFEVGTRVPPLQFILPTALRRIFTKSLLTALLRRKVVI